MVVLGEFKRGKSTLINAMLGKEVVSAGVTPLTSVATEIAYAENDCAMVHFMDGSKKTIDLKEIHEYATEKYNPLNRKRVGKVEAFVQSSFLADGLVLVDTPGVGSTYMHNTKSAYEYIPKADAAIFVVSADPPISKAECDFIRDVRKYVDKIFFVQNKVDYLAEEDMAESLTFTQGVIASEVGSAGIELYPISARLALEAKKSGNTEILHESMLPAFESDIGGFLVKGKGETLLESVGRKTANLLADLELALSLERKAITTPYDELAAKAQEFSDLAKRIEREQMEAEWILDGEVERLSAEVIEEIENFKAQATASITRELDICWSETEDASIKNLPEILTQFVKARILQYFTSFREAAVSLAEDRFRQIAGHLACRIAPRIADIKASAARLYNMEIEIRSEPIHFQQETDFYFRLDELPTLLPLKPGTLQSFLPKRVAREMIRRATTEKAYMLVDRQCGRIRYDVLARLNNSTSLLKREMQRRFQDLLSLTEGLFNKTLERQKSGRAEISARVSELDNLSAKIADISPPRAAAVGDSCRSR